MLFRSIAYAAMRDFTNQETGVIIESCEHDPQPSPDLPPGCQQDELLVRCPAECRTLPGPDAIFLFSSKAS